MHKNFSDEFKQSLYQKIDQACIEADGPLYAAFDADGTLWDMDLGENFFDYKIQHKLVDLPDNAWEHYENLKKENHHKAYLWLAQICKGHRLEQVQAWAKSAIEAKAPLPIFKDIKDLISYLTSKGVKVYIVTASIKWAVEPAGHYFSIPYEQVLGIETEDQNGVLIDKQKGVITYREGKPAALLEKTNQTRPILAAGNTMGDYFLLESASHIKLSIQSHGPNQENYSTEQELKSLAIKNGWFHHEF